MKDEKIRVQVQVFNWLKYSFIAFPNIELGHVDNIRYLIFLSRNNSTFAVNVLVLLVYLAELNSSYEISIDALSLTCKRVRIFLNRCSYYF